MRYCSTCYNIKKQIEPFHIHPLSYAADNKLFTLTLYSTSSVINLYVTSFWEAHFVSLSFCILRLNVYC